MAQTKDKIQDFIKSYLDYMNQADSLTYDSLRKKDRFEQVAAYVYACCYLEKKDQRLEECVNLLLEKQLADGHWAEYAYGVEDERIGFSGLVTSSFVLISLAKYYQSFNQSEQLLAVIVLGCDKIYSLENNGSIRKAIQNKSDVLNTNLLGAIAIQSCLELLPEKSNRKKLYKELCQRVIRKVLKNQSPSGFFPYHNQCKSVPFLYQAMVAAELRFLMPYNQDPLLVLSIQKANQALKMIIDQSGKAMWEKANNHDKKGAQWFYSFALASLDSDKIQASVVSHLEKSWTKIFSGDDFKQEPDSFYTSWMIFGFIWSKQKAPLVSSWQMGTNLRYLVCKIHYFINYAKFVFSYLMNRWDNFIFNSGSLENRYWDK